MKVVLIGGSSPSTPALIDYLAGVKGFSPIEVVLLARSEINLALVSRACSALIGDSPITVTPISLAKPNWPDTIVGADVIVLQARVGGYEARAWDETFPLRYGVCGDQDLGPGGLANGWRSWPELRRFFLEAASRAPKAKFLVLSSPVGLLVRLGMMVAPRLCIFGVCELPQTTLLEICALLKTPYRKLNLGYLGLHHLGWFYQIRSGARNLISEYAAATKGLNRFPTADLVISYSAIPTKYFRLHFDENGVLAEQRQSAGSRSGYLAQHRERAFAAFEDGDLGRIKTALTARPTPWYGHALGPLILAMTGVQIAHPFFLSRLNDSILDDVSGGEILELAHRIRDQKVQPLTLPRPIPDGVLNCLRPFLRAERLAAAAINQQEPGRLKEALAVHPWTHLHDDAERTAILRGVLKSLH